MNKSIWCAVTSLFCLFAISCNNISNLDDKEQGPVFTLKLASNEIPLWVQNSSNGYFSFSSTTLKKRLKDMAALYTDEGLVNGFIQEMADSLKFVTLYVMDFGTDSNALSMYRKMDMLNSDELSLTGYDSSVVEIDKSPSDGITVYAHFDTFFIRIFFTGFTSEADAMLAAQNFIKLLETKIAAIAL